MFTVYGVSGCCGACTVHLYGRRSVNDLTLDAINERIQAGRYGVAFIHILTVQRKAFDRQLQADGWTYVNRCKNPKTGHIIHTYTKVFNEGAVREQRRAF